MADKIILKFKTKNILNFYEIEPRAHIHKTLLSRKLIACNYIALVSFYE